MGNRKGQDELLRNARGLAPALRRRKRPTGAALAPAPTPALAAAALTAAQHPLKLRKTRNDY